MLPRQILRPALFALALVAAAPAHAADPAFPTASRIGMVAPAGFAPSSRFAGFENPFASALITLAELPADAYADVEKGFSNDELLKSRGWTIKVREPLTFKDGKGFFIAGPQESQGQKRYEAVMVANTGGITSLVSVQMVAESSCHDHRCGPARHVQDCDGPPHRAGERASRCPSLQDRQSRQIPPREVGAPGCRALDRRTEGRGDCGRAAVPADRVAPGGTPKPEERDAFAKRVFSAAPGIKDVKITRAEPLRIGQAQGYEIVAEAKDASSGTEVTTVQWLRFGQNASLQMFAIAKKTAWNDVFPRLRQIRDSIEPRYTRHARPCAGHPRLTFVATKTWMAGTSPAMTKRNPTYRYCRSRRLPPEPLSARPSTRRPALGAARVRRWCSRAA